MSTNKSIPPLRLRSAMSKTAGPSLQHPHRHIAKSASVISLATVASRILGFIRDILIAKLFGTASHAQAFVVAFRIPNLLRDLVGEGATNSAVVPVFSEYLAQKKKEEFWKLFNVVLNLFLIFSAIITILGIAFTPLIVRLIAPGFTSQPEKLLLTIKLTRIMFPYLILIGLTAYSMGILFTFKSFFTPAFSPCLLNIAMIFSAVIAASRMQEPVVGLAIGVVVGGVLQLAFQIPALYKKGMVLSRVKKFSHPGAKKIGRLLLPRIFGSAVYQLNLVIDTICASLASVVGEGSIAAIYYANRVVQFPLGVFGIALASVILPTMSGYAANKDMDKLKQTLAFSLRSIFLVMLPCGIILLVFSEPIIKILFQRGEFNSYSTQITSRALLFYALGLFAYSGVKILVSAFYSLQDTVTPVKVATISLIVNVVLNFTLMWPLKVGGIALASAISATVNYFMLYHMLEKRMGKLAKGLRQYFIKVAIAASLMGLFLVLIWHNLFLGYHLILRFAVSSFLGVLIFIAACLLLEIGEMKKLISWLLNKG
ncbi:MAG: murein biosynthesis integral membrane protein MurJ [Candidatus Omnitrophota bacterium]|nr:murein biosynthesis integral membrane protein MurJ [Candidatus Omnitrophota bacterium]